MKTRTLSVVFASVTLAASASAAPSVHRITKASGTQVCGKNTELTVSIAAPKNARGTLRLTPVAAPQLAQRVSYTGNGKSVSVPVSLPLSCAVVKGIRMTLDDGKKSPTWLVPNEMVYSGEQLGHPSMTHIQRVETTTRSAHSRFAIRLIGGTNGQLLRGTLEVVSVHSGEAGAQLVKPTRFSSDYSVRAGQVMTHSFGHHFPNGASLSAFHVFFNGSKKPVVASRKLVTYGL